MFKLVSTKSKSWKQTDHVKQIMRVYINIFIHLHHSNPDTRRNSSLVAVNVAVDPERKLKPRRLYQHFRSQTREKN